MNKKKLEELRIPKKEMGKFMKEGKYQFEDGRSVFLKDVREEDIPAQVIFILDIPDFHSLHHLV